MVRVGSIFERSHVPLHKWLLAIRLMASSKKGISAHQLHRTLGITYKSAWLGLLPWDSQKPNSCACLSPIRAKFFLSVKALTLLDQFLNDAA
jgi:hypothetical protein